MFTLISLPLLAAAIVAGFKYGLSADTILMASAIFAVAGAINTAAIYITEAMKK